MINQLKLPEDMMPRILEEEGFYIQKKPEIYKKTCNKMENRLLKLEEASSLPDKLNHHWQYAIFVFSVIFNYYILKYF